MEKFSRNAFSFWHLAFDQQPTATNSQRPTTFTLNPFMRQLLFPCDIFILLSLFIDNETRKTFYTKKTIWI